MVFTEFLFGYFPVSVCKSLIFMENIREIDLVSHFMSFKVIVIAFTLHSSAVIQFSQKPKLGS